MPAPFFTKKKVMDIIIAEPKLDGQESDKGDHSNKTVQHLTPHNHTHKVVCLWVSLIGKKARIIQYSSHMHIFIGEGG